jgi:hypothetical protein
MLQMKYRKRIYYTEADKALMWDRWQKGDTLHEIARLFGRHHSSVRGILERPGGIRPPVRRRSSRSLTLAEREEIGSFAVDDQSRARTQRRFSRLSGPRSGSGRLGPSAAPEAL